MKACVLFEAGPAENLKIIEVRDPGPPGEGEILVRVEACGIDGHDAVTRSGLLGRGLQKHPIEVLHNGTWTTREAAILGHEISGTVLEIGPGVTTISNGDRVTNNIRATCRTCSYCREGRSNNCKRGSSVEGGYAELAVLPIGSVIKVPDGVGAAEACIVSCAIGTPWRGFTRPGVPTFKDRILVTGAGGGLGVHAVQIAALSGGFVMATTTSESKVPLLKELGASKVILNSTGRFADDVLRVTDGHGADVILDTVGGTTFNSGGFRSLAEYGRYVFVGQINAEFARFAVPFLFWKEAIVTGTGTPDYLDMQAGLDLVAARRVRSVISSTFRLEETPRYHAMLEQKQVFGRSVIEFPV